MSVVDPPSGSCTFAMPPYRIHLAVTLALLVAGSSRAQTTFSNDPFHDLPPPSTRPEEAPVRKLVFRLEAEIPLPGPLPPSSPRWTGDGVEVAVAGGTMVARPVADATPRWVDGDARDHEAASGSRWVEDERGKSRYRARPGGTIEAQRKCRRCKDGWKRRWKLRVPGNTVAPPLVAGRRLYFGALDNQVYCVKARSGHRVWVADLGGRISSPLVHWTGFVGRGVDPAAADDGELSVILVVPDEGSELVALDGERGSRVAGVRLAEGGGKLVGGPLATPEGRIVVARQKYAENEASLMVYSLIELSPQDTPPPRPSPDTERAGP